MRELSLNILDIAHNSLQAGATLIQITVEIKGDEMAITIKDNGKGIKEDKLKQVQDPFVTERTTRKVGLGIPLFKMSAEMAGGEFFLDSAPDKGTEIGVTYKLGHIDRMPLGALEDTIIALIGEAPQADYQLIYKREQAQFEFSTSEIKAQLQEVDIDNAEVLMFLREYIANNIKTINGGAII